MNVQPFSTYIPQLPLRNFITCFWSHERATQPGLKERALPTGTMELVINLRADRLQVFDRQQTHDAQSFNGAMICGPHSEYFVIDSSPDELILGVHFKLGGTVPFLPLPASELHNTHVSLDTLWGANAVNLREQLLEAKTLAARFQLLEQSLLAQVKQAPVMHPAVTFALKTFQVMPFVRTISEVTDQIGISQRHFIQVFREAVGLTPKEFCRVRRFQEVLYRIRNKQQVEWASIALDCGYYDQAHLINDFQFFSGLNPSAYVRDRDECRFNHVPLTEIRSIFSNTNGVM